MFLSGKQHLSPFFAEMVATKWLIMRQYYENIPVFVAGARSPSHGDSPPVMWWWMHKDIESMLKLWGKKYNEVTDVSPVTVQRTVYDSLDETFTKNDVYVVCMKQGIKTPIRRIIFDWKKLGYLEELNKETFKKKKL